MIVTWTRSGDISLYQRLDHCRKKGRGQCLAKQICMIVMCTSGGQKSMYQRFDHLDRK